MNKVFNRPPRILRSLPEPEISLPTPPKEPQKPQQRLISLLAPLLTAAVYILVAQLRGSHGGGLIFVLPMIALSCVTVCIGVYTAWEQRRSYRSQLREARHYWQHALTECEQSLHTAWKTQAILCHENDPAPHDLLHITKQPAQRLWERRPTDPDFMHLRVGVGTRSTTTRIKQAHSQTEAHYQKQLDELTRRYKHLRDVPITLDIAKQKTLGIVGPQEQQRSSTLALLWQAVTHHSSDDLRIAAFWKPEEDRYWQWLRHIPHTRPLNGEQHYRLLAHSQADAEATIGLYEHSQHICEQLTREIDERRQQPQQQRPFLLIVMCDSAPNSVVQPLLQTALTHSLEQTSLIVVAEQRAELDGRCQGYLDVSQQPAILAQTGIQGQTHLLSADRPPAEQSRELAKHLLRIQRPITQQGRDVPGHVDFLELVGINDLDNYDPQHHWRAEPPTNAEHPSGLYPVPIGQYGPTREHTTYLDLNEKHEGVHGMIAGTTGSGKSELLTTLILGLALYHHPDRLNLLLIDFKGGATFRDLAPLPHTAGLVTDLAGNGAERALTAINSELDRRKQHFASYGVPNIRQYRQSSSGPKLPNLLIAIDEFDEMARDYPLFIEELIRVAKQGRSLGVHLLFATQTPSNGAIKAGLKTNLTYWIALRVVDSEDSKLMVGSRAASSISNTTPGRAYKRIGSHVTVFQSALATAPYIAPHEREDTAFFIQDALGRWISPQQRQATKAVGQHNRQITAEKLIQRLQTGIPACYAADTYRIWQDPLPAQLTLAPLLPAHQPTGLSAYLGLQDHPQHAEQPAFTIDFSQVGHVVVLGSSGSGKTTALQTCLTSLAQLYSPEQIQYCVIDAHGTALGYSKLPHIGIGLSFKDNERIERLLALIEHTINERQQLFHSLGIANWISYQSAECAEPVPAWLLIIDDYPQFVEHHQALVPTLTKLLRTGRSYGIFSILSSDRYASSSFPADLKSTIGQKIVLRMHSETDSVDILNKPIASRIATTNPGRGYIPSQPKPTEIQIALPETPNFIHSSHSYSFPHIDTLPTTIQFTANEWQTAAWLATERYQLQPLKWQQQEYAHLLICGSRRYGSADIIQTALASLIWQNTHQDTHTYILDYRAQDLSAWQATSQQVTYITKPFNQQTPWVQELEQRLSYACESEYINQTTVLVIHEIELLESSELNYLARWSRWALQATQLNFHILITTNDLPSISSNALIKRLKQDRHILILADCEINPTQLGLGTKALQWPSSVARIPYRAIWITAETEQIVQCWQPPLDLLAQLEQHTYTLGIATN